MAKIRVVVAGATGKTGSAVTQALLGEDDIQVVAAVARRSAGSDLGQAMGTGFLGIPVAGDLEAVLAENQADVLVDFTAPSVAGPHALAAVARGVRPVIGTTGIPAEQLRQLERECARRGLGGAVIANFSFGMMLLSQFVLQAAEVFPNLEIVEKHHQTKVDAPSGTALRLAQRLAGRGHENVPIHSIRLPGLVAHHEVVFGGTGETLTIKHDSISRASFGTGVVLAVRRVMELDRIVYDLSDLMS